MKLFIINCRLLVFNYVYIAIIIGKFNGIYKYTLLKLLQACCNNSVVKKYKI